MATLNTDEKKDIKTAFDEVVNMSATELKKWLKTDESKSVGQHIDGAAESTGHQSGERIVDLLGTKNTDLTDDDYAQM